MTRISPLRSVALAALFGLSACDAGPIDPQETAAAPTITEGCAHPEVAPREPDLLGRVILDSDELVPVSQAQVVVEFEGRNGEELESLVFDSDDEGYFALERVPANAKALTAYVFIDGELAGDETVPVVDGKPVKKILGVVVVTAWTVCIVTTWASARKVAGNDKMKHCTASCRATRWCGGAGSAWTAGVLKEIFDSICSAGPQWLKNLLSPASGCSGWDSADIAADNQGIACAYRWRTCEGCCDDYY
jgi:hypothetical protein